MQGSGRGIRPLTATVDGSEPRSPLAESVLLCSEDISKGTAVESVVCAGKGISSGIRSSAARPRLEVYIHHAASRMLPQGCMCTTAWHSHPNACNTNTSYAETLMHSVTPSHRAKACTSAMAAHHAEHGTDRSMWTGGTRGPDQGKLVPAIAHATFHSPCQAPAIAPSAVPGTGGEQA
jgi:hypothetical protein